jgi:hypothetical protein
LKNLQKLIDGKRDKVAVALTETLDDEKLAARVAAIFGLASLDEPEKLVGVLGTEERERLPGPPGCSLRSATLAVFWELTNTSVFN